jgi:hypothetical protein
MEEPILDGVVDLKKDAPLQPKHYVNNKEFVAAVVEYTRAVNAAKAAEREPPRIPEYIGECFIAIAERSSRRSNFISYPYREEMVTDGILDCVKAIMNYDIDAPTRGGAPNAFGYFTQIVFWAFLRRIAREKKQTEIKNKYRDHAGINAFADFGGDDDSHHLGEGMIERVRHRNDMFNANLSGIEPIDEICEALKKKPKASKTKRGFPPRTKKEPTEKPVKPKKTKTMTLEHWLES